jgi:hypothetical protein
LHDRVNHRAPWVLGLVTAGALAISGCAGSASPPLTPSATPSALSSYGSLGPGFFDPENPPAPEGTLAPPAGSWDDAHPPVGYTVTLVEFGDDAQTTTLVKAVTDWAIDEKVALTTLTPDSHLHLLDSLHTAIGQKPDLIITAGAGMVDPLAAVSAGYLDQDFLVVGAEIAEPTANVTAADWSGAGFRGEGLGSPTDYDPSTFTDERAGRALRAGVGAIVNGITGIVVWVS